MPKRLPKTITQREFDAILKQASRKAPSVTLRPLDPAHQSVGRSGHRREFCRRGDSLAPAAPGHPAGPGAQIGPSRARSA
jgi:hypothetical protein